MPVKGYNMKSLCNLNKELVIIVIITIINLLLSLIVVFGLNYFQPAKDY